MNVTTLGEQRRGVMAFSAPAPYKPTNGSNTNSVDCNNGNFKELLYPKHIFILCALNFRLYLYKKDFSLFESFGTLYSFHHKKTHLTFKAWDILTF